jgi:hypothetical protein
MATTKQKAAAKRNIRKARAAASKRRTIARLPEEVRKDLGRQGARARARGARLGEPSRIARGNSSTTKRSASASPVARRWASGT